MDKKDVEALAEGLYKAVLECKSHADILDRARNVLGPVPMECMLCDMGVGNKTSVLQSSALSILTTMAVLGAQVDAMRAGGSWETQHRLVLEKLTDTFKGILKQYDNPEQMRVAQGKLEALRTLSMIFGRAPR